MKSWYCNCWTGDHEPDTEALIDNSNESNDENIDTNYNDANEEIAVGNGSKGAQKSESSKRAKKRKHSQSTQNDEERQEIVAHNEETIQCDICKETFLTERKLLFHKNRHEKNSSEGKLYDQFMMENFDMSCDECDAKFTSFKDAQRHYKASHNDDKGYLKCCGTKLKSFTLVRDHIKKHLNPESFKYVWQDDQLVFA